MKADTDVVLHDAEVDGAWLHNMSPGGKPCLPGLHSAHSMSAPRPFPS